MRQRNQQKGGGGAAKEARRALRLRQGQKHIMPVGLLLGGAQNGSCFFGYDPRFSSILGDASKGEFKTSVSSSCSCSKFSYPLLTGHLPDGPFSQARSVSQHLPCFTFHCHNSGHSPICLLPLLPSNHSSAAQVLEHANHALSNNDDVCHTDTMLRVEYQSRRCSRGGNLRRIMVCDMGALHGACLP